MERNLYNFKLHENGTRLKYKNKTENRFPYEKMSSIIK